jgi:hypothetical protein
MLSPASAVPCGAAVVQNPRSPDTIPIATDSECYSAFDYTCQYYLGMPAREFLDRLKADAIPPDTPHLSRVLDMLPLVS